RMIFLHPLDRQDLLIGGKVKESPTRIVSKFFRGIENQLTQIQNIQPIDAAVAVDIGGYFHILTLQCLFLQDAPLDIDQISSTDPITESNVFVRYDAYFGSMVNAKLEMTIGRCLHVQRTAGFRDNFHCHFLYSTSQLRHNTT